MGERLSNGMEQLSFLPKQQVYQIALQPPIECTALIKS